MTDIPPYDHTHAMITTLRIFLTLGNLFMIVVCSCVMFPHWEICLMINLIAVILNGPILYCQYVKWSQDSIKLDHWPRR